MRNPLNRRLPRELRSEFGKYLVIFLLLSLTIGLISGFLVADGSMITAYRESFEKYNIEDGHFETGHRMNRAQTKAVSDLGIRLYENFYTERKLTNGSTMRFYAMRDQVNKVCLMEGKFPEGKDEIAIDRMYADNNGLSVGDEISTSSRSFQVTGLVALSDYSALFSDNSDAMFDSIKFGVGVVTRETFDDFDDKKMTWCYAWKYGEFPDTEAKEKEISEDLMEKIGGEVSLTAFVPRYQNQAIRFAGEDMSSDRAMMLILLYIIIGIMAFVFAITTSNTIMKEAAVIGTLRASGYSRSELVSHYMTMPVIVTLIGALVGNITGYTYFKELCAAMYYGSYSLPAYVTIWNGEAFVLTTVIPVIMMLVINLLILTRKLALPPLKFIRRDLTGRKQGRALPLYKGIPFFIRFHLRVILQNLTSWLLLFTGIAFSTLLLLFGVALPAVLTHYQEELSTNMLSNYQYMLTIPAGDTIKDQNVWSLLNMMVFSYSVETDNVDAEKFSIRTMKTISDGFYKSEEINCYGVEPDSKYFKASIPEGEAFVSVGFSEKYELKKGDRITLKEAYEDKTYDFKVAGIYNYRGSLSLFMNRKEMNKLFGEEDDFFCGYFSDTEITDIDRKYIGTVIDIEALTKISRQLDRSMGGMMNLVNVFAVAIFLVVIYLLTKIIIEKNGRSISLAKILGYHNREIGSLYLLPTSLMVILFFLVSIPLDYKFLAVLFRYMMIREMTGWMALYVPEPVYVKVFAIGVLSYLAVAVLEYIKISKVPMDEVLRDTE